MVDRRLKTGERVLFTGDPAIWSSHQLLPHFKEKNIYGVVCDERERSSYYAQSDQELVEFRHSLGNKMGKLCLGRSTMELIPEDKYAEYDAIKAQDERNAELLFDEIKALSYNPSKESHMNRTFNFVDRQSVNTNHNYACTGVWDKKKGTFELENKNYRPQCCAFTKTMKDVDIYVPTVWLNYYGYTIYDLVEWMKFLSKCEIGFQYEYMGIGTLAETFKSNVSATDEGYYENISLGKYQSFIYPKGMNGFHRILLGGDREFKMYTYLRFICLRYIYNHQYWTIPGHAMQIKKSLGKLVTHWEALMMAHLHQPFYGYYCLASQTDRDPNKDYLDLKEGQIMATTKTNYDRHVDVFQSREAILEKLKTSEKMNETFSYLKDVLNREELNKFFAAKDYLGLYKYLLSKKVAQEKA